MADIDNIVHLSCRKHQSYTLQRKPSGDCEDCWDAWLRKRKYLKEQGEEQARSDREDRYSR